MIDIRHGDSVEVMNSLPAGCIDMVCSDFPYNLTKAGWDKKLPLSEIWGEYKRICKPNAPIVLFGYGRFSAELILSNPEWYKYSMVWAKTTPTGHLNAKKQPLRLHEDIHVFYKNQCIYNPQKTTGHVRKVSSAHHKRSSKETELYNQHGKTDYDSTERYPTTILTYPTDKQKEYFTSTQKPMALLEYLISTYTNKGALILDNCGGSGGVNIAAENLGRDSIYIDNDISKVNIITERYLKLQAA